MPVDVITSEKGDDASLTERLKKLEVGEVCLIYKGGDIAHLRTTPNRQRKQATTIWFDTPKNRLVLGLADKKATYAPEPVLSATNDLRELAIQAVRMLGADHVKEAVDYLTAVFKTVSTGNVPNPNSANSPVAAQENGIASTDPLTAARARGRRSALEEYESPDNLALLDARDYAGRNERTINEQRQNGELYALLSPGKTRGFRYPKWQFDATPEDFNRAFEHAAALNPDNYTLYDRKMEYLKPEWRGDSDRLLAFGRECLETENWRAGISPKTGNPVYTRPIILTLRR